MANPNSTVLSLQDYVTERAVTLSGNSWDTNYPLTNLTDSSFSKFIRSTGSLNNTFTISVAMTNPQTMGIGVVGMFGLNLSKNALWAVTGYDNASNIVYQTAGATGYSGQWIPIFPSWIDQGALYWGHPGYYDGLVDDDLFAATPRSTIIYFGQVYPIYSLLIQIYDPSNTNGYLQISRVFAGGAWQPSINMTYGASMTWEDTATLQESHAGVKFFDSRAKRRSARFSLSNLPNNEMRFWSQEVGLRQGLVKQWVYIKDPTATNLSVDSFLARMRSLSPLEAAAFGVSSEAFELEEVTG